MEERNYNSDYCEYCFEHITSEAKLCPKCGKIREIGDPKSLKAPTQFLRRQTYWNNFLVGFIGLQILSIVVGLIVAAKIGISLINPKYPNAYSRYIVITTFVSYGIVLIELLIWNIKFNRGAFLADFKNIKAYIAGAAGTLVLFGVSLLYSYLIEPLNLGTNDNQSSITFAFHYFPVLMTISTVIFAPLVEELTFRVGLFNLCKKNYKVVGYIVSILVFALLHMNFINPSSWAAEFIALPQYIIAGFVLTFIYDKFGFAASLSAHMLNNLISLILIFVL